MKWKFSFKTIWVGYSKCMKGTRVLLANTKGKWLSSISKDSINMTWNISPTKCEYHQTKFVYRPNEMRIAVCNSCKIDWNQWKQSGTYHRNLVMTRKFLFHLPKGTSPQLGVTSNRFHCHETCQQSAFAKWHHLTFHVIQSPWQN